MDDVFFQLGLLKADPSSYISLLPIPILNIIKDYLKGELITNTKYIIWNNKRNEIVFTSRHPKLDDFFEKMYNGNYELNNFVSYVSNCINIPQQPPYLYNTIMRLKHNKQLLFDILRENKQYSLIAEYKYKYRHRL